MGGWVAVGCIALGLVAAGCGGVPTATPPAREIPVQEEVTMLFSLSSPAFGANQAIPSRYTCDGQDLSPTLAWGEPSQGTAAFALIVDDPDAPGRVFTHWVLFNLPSTARGLPEGVPKVERLESGALQGRNDFGRIGYGGPCPPRGSPHRYRFFLYALDASLDLAPGASKQQVLDRLRGHVLGEAQLVGTYQRR